MQFESQAVPFDTIDLTDHTFRISSKADPDWLEGLAGSIDRLGLVEAPFILETDSQRRIVSGFRRIAACRRLGLKAVCCRMLGPETAMLTAAHLAVAQNAWQRPLNLMEKARAFALLGKGYPQATEISEAAKPLGLVENPPVIAKLIHLTTLPKSLKRAVESGDIGLAMALELGKLAAEARRQMLALFQTFHFGLNRQRQLLTLVAEIAARESNTVEQVLASNEIRTALARADKDRPARGRVLIQQLKRRRYPTLTEMESAYARLERRLELGNRARMVPPPYFEGKTFGLNLAFDTLEELGGHLKKLGELKKDPGLKRLLEKRYLTAKTT